MALEFVFIIIVHSNTTKRSSTSTQNIAERVMIEFLNKSFYLISGKNDYLRQIKNKIFKEFDYSKRFLFR
jgi:hypothetical protein